jgi:hypothetical protein
MASDAPWAAFQAAWAPAHSRGHAGAPSGGEAGSGSDGSDGESDESYHDSDDMV